MLWRVRKAGAGDCPTAACACTGTGEEDSDPTAFIYVPKGPAKDLGASLTPKA